MKAGLSEPGSRVDWAKILVIGMMYMAEVFPAGFVTSLVPTLYRKEGLPLQDFWIFSIPVIPYWLRWAIGPVIDTYWSPKIGRRRSWIAPFTVLAVIMYASLALISPTIPMLKIVIGLLFVKTLFAATQEVAIDAYVVDNVSPNERPAAAAAHVIFEAVAQVLALAGLGLIVQKFGWRAGALTAALLMLIFLLPALLRRERPAPPSALERLAQPKNLARAFAPLGAFLRRRDSWYFIPMLFFSGIFTGALLPIMGPFLVDQGFNVSQVGATVGVVLGISAIGGALISMGVVQRFGPHPMMLVLAVAAPLCVLPVAWIAYSHTHWPHAVVGTALFLPVFVTSLFFVTFVTVRLGVTAAAQSGTDYAAASAFSRIAQTGAAAAGGPIAAVLGWQGFFLTLGLVGAFGIGAVYVAYRPFIRLVAIRNAAAEIPAIA